MFVSKYDKVQKAELLGNFKTSNMSVPSYAKKIGVSPNTFRVWLEKEKSIASNQFGIVNLVKSSEAKIADELEIFIKTKEIKIELYKGYNKKMLKKIIEVITDDK